MKQPEQQATLRELDDLTDMFRRGVAEVIAAYETASGNKVSANFTITFQDNPGKQSPLCYCRDLSVVEDDGVERAAPRLSSLLDVNPDLCIMPIKNEEDDAYIDACFHQVQEYADSSKGPFMVSAGTASYQKNALQELGQKLRNRMPPELEKMLTELFDSDGNPKGPVPKDISPLVANLLGEMAKAVRKNPSRSTNVPGSGTLQ